MLTDTLNDFLSVGKIEEGKVHVRPTPVVLPEWMDLMLDELGTILKKGQGLQYTHEGDAAVMLDTTLFTHIVQNLVSNAAKFSPEDATIVLTTIRVPGSLTLSVSDTGIGIPKEDQKHLFERFFSRRQCSKYPGLGAGSAYRKQVRGDARRHCVV